MAAVPPNLKPLNSFLKLAKEYDKRDPTIAYFCRMYAVQKGIKLDSKSPDCKMFLIGMMDQLENVKKELIAAGDESVSNDIVAQAHLETKTIDLFTWADTEDRKGVFNKNITKAFYSASLLFEVLTQFGEQNDECKVMQRYSKWKATYLHKCLQTGETPQPGPQGSGFEDDLGGIGETMGLSNLPSGSSQDPSNIPSTSGGQFHPPPDLPDIPDNSRAPETFSPPSHQPPPQQPPPQKQPSRQPTAVLSSGSLLDASDIDVEQVQKLCKFAMSALQYEDVATTVDNLTKALNLLKKQ